MTTNVLERVAGVGGDGRRGTNLLIPAAMLAAAAFVQVTVMPRVGVGEFRAVPNVVIVVVVALAVLRGVVVGATAGFVGGLAVELLTPGQTLGVIAFACVAIGAWCGRYAALSDPVRWWLFTTLAAVGAGLVPFWVGIVDLLRGVGLPLAVLMPDVVMPHMTFAALMAPAVWWVARRLLGSPRIVEPGMMRG